MSNTIYIGYYFKVKPLKPAVEILIAELGYAGFESFVETEEGATAYIQKDEWNENILHDKFDTKYDIIIEPKMSFGTGHHETTHMMIQHILKNDFKNKSVLDMGCGTGVLAILAELKGAKPIDAIDYDNWCYLNSLENVERNNRKHITVIEGDASVLKNKYDVIIANINRNILMQDLATYISCLNKGGMLFLSGFYNEDITMIKAECEKYLLKFEEKLERNNWVSLKFLNWL